MDPHCARFEYEWQHGDRALARELAREYVEAHASRLAPRLDPYSLEDIVRLIDAYRAAGHEEDRVIADMWLLARYPPQQISGAIDIGGGAALARALSDALARGEAL